jgi:hypothetical protein
MRRIGILALAFALTLVAVAAQAQSTGTLSGTAQSSNGQSLANYTVQLRNVQTGALVGSTTSNAAGSFTFDGLNPANYVVEIVNSAGQVVGTSAVTAVAAGAAVTVSVTAAAAASLTTSGGVSTAVIITTVAAVAGVAGIVVAANNGEASPSR